MSKFVPEYSEMFKSKSIKHFELLKVTKKITFDFYVNGIEIDTAANVNISANVCLNNSGNGIDIAGHDAQRKAYRVNVVGNQCHDTGAQKVQQYGLSVRNASHVTIIGNSVSGNKVGSIHKDDNVASSMEANNQ